MSKVERPPVGLPEAQEGAPRDLVAEAKELLKEGASQEDASHLLPLHDALREFEILSMTDDFADPKKLDPRHKDIAQISARKLEQAIDAVAPKEKGTSKEGEKNVYSSHADKREAVLTLLKGHLESAAASAEFIDPKTNRQVIDSLQAITEIEAGKMTEETIVRSVIDQIHEVVDYLVEEVEPGVQAMRAISIDQLSSEIQRLYTEHPTLANDHSTAAVREKITREGATPQEALEALRELKGLLEQIVSARKTVNEVPSSVNQTALLPAVHTERQAAAAEVAPPEAPPARPRKRTWKQRLVAAALIVGSIFGMKKDSNDVQPEFEGNEAPIAAKKDATAVPPTEERHSASYVAADGGGAENNEGGAEAKQDSVDPDGDKEIPAEAPFEELLSVERAKSGDGFNRIMDRFLNNEDNKEDLLELLREKEEQRRATAEAADEEPGPKKIDRTLLREWRNGQLEAHGIEWQKVDGEMKQVYTDKQVDIGDRFSLLEIEDENGKHISIEWEKVGDIDDEKEASEAGSEKAEVSETPGVTVGGQTFDYGETILMPDKSGVYQAYTVYQPDSPEAGEYAMVEGSRTIGGTDAEVPTFTSIDKGNVDSVRRGHMLGNFAVEPLPGDGFKMHFTKRDGKGIIRALAALLEQQMNMSEKDALNEARKVVKRERNIVDMNTLSTHRRAPNLVRPGDSVTFKQTSRGWRIESVETGK